MENGLVTKGARLVIPSTLRSKVLEQIHEGHLGIEKCMFKVRDSVFWPGISMRSERLWRNVEFVKQVPRHPNLLEM